MQPTYISTLVDVTPKASQRKREHNKARRQRGATLHYHLKVNGPKKQVCQHMFLETFGLNSNTVAHWVAGAAHGVHQTEGEKKHPQKKKLKSRKTGVTSKTFLVLFPTCHHITAGQTQQTAIWSRSFKTKTLYNLYQVWCNENNKKVASKWLLLCVFEEINLSFFHPKKGSVRHLLRT